MRALPLLFLAALPALAQSGDAVLAQVDRLRHPWPAFTVVLEVRDERTTQRWKVSARENGDARLDGLSEKERGRAVLALGADMWLLLPGTKRPLKVTPQQRLLGPAAGGDVARTRFRQDYAVRACAEDRLDGRPCWRLDLEARSPALSARTIQLWVERDTTAPLRAEFFMASGKRARVATFGPPATAHGQPVLSWMELEEASGAKVTLRFGPWTKGPVDPERFDLP